MAAKFKSFKKPTKEELENSYSRLKSIRKVGIEFGYTGEGIRGLMKKFGIVIAMANKYLYSCDETSFLKDNEESFYWAGFIAADGCVMIKNEKNNHHTIPNLFSISLCTKDESHLIKLKNYLQSTYPIKYTTDDGSTRNPDWGISYKCGFAITSKILCANLARFNIVPRKTLIYEFPKWLIDHPLAHHFMRGYVDGDGCWREMLGINVPQATFNVLGTYNLTSVFKLIFEREGAVPRDGDWKVFKKKRVFGLSYGGNGVASGISKFLYKDVTLCLERKYIIAQRSVTANNVTLIKKQEIVKKKLNKARLKFRRKSNIWLSYQHPKNILELEALYHSNGTVGNLARALGKRTPTVKQLLLNSGIKLLSAKN